MKIVPIEDKKKIEEIMNSRRTYKYGKLQSIIQKFIDSEAQIAEVTEIDDYKEIYSATSGLNHAAKRMNIGVRAFTGNGHVYLIKTA